MTQLIKRFLIFALFSFITFYPWKVSFAQENDNNFYVNTEVVYQVDSETKTKVTQDISIVNRKEFVYSPSYSITLHLKNISDISVKNSKGPITYKLQEGAENKKTIDIEFPDKVIGEGKQNNFTISYTSTDFAHKVGSVLTVSIPSLSGGKSFNEYSINVIVPSEYTSPSIVKPQVSYEQKGSVYTFSKSALIKNGVELIFGDNQLYKFDLSYHLENNNVFPIKTEIALPPNTSYQEVLIESLSPKPDSTYTDSDGNILATYTISPKTTIHAKAEVLVNVVSKPKTQELSNKEKELYLKPQKYWEVNDPEIQKIAKNLKTPEAIYSYVVKNLSYDEGKTEEKNTRLGAKQVLSKPYFAVCLEFTDLFVTLARAAGIPARSVEGYAYTNDDSDKPRSLFQDILHAWPEYYDAEQKTWVMVDPTWQNTTRGMDYFNSFDYDHVAFVVNGAQSTYPVPAGGYKTSEASKDIAVTFPSNVEFEKTNEVGVSASYSSFSHNNAIQGKLTLTNNGNSELTSYTTTVYIDGIKSQEVVFPKTPPFGKSTVSVSVQIPKGKSILSLTNITHKVTIQGENGVNLTSSTVRVFPFSEYFIIGGALFVGLAFVLILAIKTRSISVQR